MNLRVLSIGLIAISVAAQSPAATPARGSAKDSEITSDSMQIEKGGKRTVFEGNVRGTWGSSQGEKVVATGERAVHRPTDQITELWGSNPPAEMTRWENAKDTAPVVVQALHLTARQKKNDVLAKGKVFITQAPRWTSYSDEGRYDRTAGTLDLWGPSRVKIHVEDAKGKSDFESDKAWVLLEPRRSRLTGNVKGHVVPSPL